MIWYRGEVLDDHALQIGVADRAFEHGLGLFETFRTWNGRAVLLPLHLQRMARSAEVLQLRLNPKTLPTENDVANLANAARFSSDATFRITLTGGLADGSEPHVWMTVKPLPEAIPLTGIELVCFENSVAPSDPLVQHKALNYWSRRIAFENAQVRSKAGGLCEALSMTTDGRIWEGSRTNLFAILQNKLVTPPRSGPLVPGIMRQVVLDRASAIGIEPFEGDLTLESLLRASELFVTNSVRGIIPVRRVRAREFDSPGSWTVRIRDEVLGWLNGGATEK